MQRGLEVQVRVKLPDEPLIEFSAFCMALAEAKFPTRIEHFKGIECIVGKTVRHEVPMQQRAGEEKWPISAGLQSVLLADDGRTLDQLTRTVPDSALPAGSWLALDQTSHRDVVELSLPYELGDADRRTLESILPQLPALAYPISDTDEAAFFEAYFKLRDRPAWKPDLATASWMDRRKRDYMKALEGHQKAVREEHAHGRIRAINAAHVPVAVLTGGSFIPRLQAIAYLEGCGYVIDDGSERAGAPVEQPLPPKAAAAVASTRPIELALIGDKSPESSDRAPKESAHERPNPAEISQEMQSPSVPIVAASQATGKVIRLRRVEELTGLKRSSIYNRLDPESNYYDPTFPTSFSLSTTGKGAVGWDEGEVKAWVAAQAAKAQE
jgi:predicted DNA-binding transcriptional regulator AlpA